MLYDYILENVEKQFTVGGARLGYSKKGKQKGPERATEAAANPRHKEEEKKWHRLTCA